MTWEEQVKALRRLKVETGSLACFGCGHNHHCSVHGCAILREAADLLENDQKHIGALNDYMIQIENQKESLWVENNRLKMQLEQATKKRKHGRNC